MAAYVAGKVSGSTTTKRCVREFFLTFTRESSRYVGPLKNLGYYKKKLSTPVFRRRQAEYRQNVLKALEEIPNFSERMKEINLPDPVLHAKIDIGFASADTPKLSVKDRLTWRKSTASQTGKFLKDGEIVKINLSEVEDDWLKSEGPSQIRNIADHYGIFEGLYEHGIFTPCVPLKVAYDADEDSVNPVYTGNVLQASDVSKVPNVSYTSTPDDLWSLILTNIDGHLLDNNSEYLHWFVGNIQGNNLNSGEVVCDYLQPFPMRGTGYHRLVFILYKQDKKINYSSLKKNPVCVSLKDRTFKTFDFYKEHQDFLTPAGMAFFQCTWDESLTDFFHNVLNMQEPVFEYNEPPLYIKPQVHYPEEQPFNLYLDRYRDPKEMKKEVLLKRLQMVEPFKEEAPMPKYPGLHKPDGYRFSWQRQDFRLQRFRLGRYRDLRPASVYPQEDNQFPYWKRA